MTGNLDGLEPKTAERALTLPSQGKASWLGRFLGWSLAAIMVGAPLAYRHYREACLRNFRVVHEGILYRSGQLNLTGLKRVLRDYQIRTVVTLRDGASAIDQAEEAYCRRMGIQYQRIPYLPWWASDGTVPAEQSLDKFRAVLGNPDNWPVLIHCFAGNHRTGAFCAVCRMDFDGWPNAKAIAEMRNLGYRTIDGDLDILQYLQTYRPRPPGVRSQESGIRKDDP